LKVCLECIPPFKGTGSYVVWRETTQAALANIRLGQRPDEQLLVMCLKRKLEGQAEVFIQTKMIHDLHDFWNAMEEEYHSEIARARAKDLFDNVTQGDKTGGQYFALKIAMLQGIPRPEDEMVVHAVKKGLRPEYREKLVAIHDLDTIRRTLLELDEVMALQKNSSPTLNLADRQQSKRIQGNCFWCAKKGHREVDCRAKKAGQPKARSPAPTPKTPNKNAMLNFQEE